VQRVQKPQEQGAKKIPDQRENPVRATMNILQQRSHRGF
jgi:hypothetical protein